MKPDFRAHLDPGVFPDQQDHQVLMVTKVSLAKWDHPDQVVTPVTLENPECQVCQDQKDIEVCLAGLVFVAKPDDRETRETQDQVAPQDRMDPLDPSDHQENADVMAHQDLLDCLEMTDPMARKDPQDRLEPLDHPDSQDHTDRREMRVSRVHAV